MRLLGNPLTRWARRLGPKWRWAAVLILLLDQFVKWAAIGLVPENRRPGSSFAWLLLILVFPVVGLPLFLLLGSPYVHGRRNAVQAEANAAMIKHTTNDPIAPADVLAAPGLASIVRLNRTLASMPMVTGRNEGLHGDAAESIRAMARAVEGARLDVLVEFYIMAWDDTTDVFFTALTAASRRGVRVRLLFDHLGTRGYPGYRSMLQRLTAAGVEWHPLMPIDLLRGKWRRPDLRNHRKLLVVDGEVGFMGSQNLIDSSYLKPKHVKAGRHWKDLNLELTGPIVDSLTAVFAFDWYTETGETLELERHGRTADAPQLPAGDGAFQLVPSGPGFPTEPNLRLFVTLMHRAQHRLSITSPYFVPEESLLGAITTAAHRGVDVELFVSEQADQLMVHHAQRSYYRALLEAGVRIYLYPAPTVLHAKHLTVDDEIAVIGSSNMDMRSFALDYEIMLMSYGGSLPVDLRAVQDGYRDVSRALTLDVWSKEPWHRRYVDNLMRLTSDLQ